MQGFAPFEPLRILRLLLWFWLKTLHIFKFAFAEQDSSIIDVSWSDSDLLASHLEVNIHLAGVDLHDLPLHLHNLCLQSVVLLLYSPAFLNFPSKCIF